jgi:hypothetical protein
MIRDAVSQRLRYEATTSDQHSCTNSGFTAESLGPLGTESYCTKETMHTSADLAFIHKSAAREGKIAASDDNKHEIISITVV